MAEALFTDQITFLAKRSSKLARFYLGTFAADEVNDKWRTEGSYPKFFIANTAPASKPGTHWIACIIRNRNMLEIFDSYGRTIRSYSSPLNDYAHRFSSRQENAHQWQALFSNVCGHFCLFYLYHRARGLTPLRIFHKLNKHNHIKNDRQVVSFVKRVLTKGSGRNTIKAPHLRRGQHSKKHTQNVAQAS